MSAVHGGSQSAAAMAAAAAPAAADSGKHWAPHSPLLIGCVVGINVFMIALIFFYFWRFFSGKRGPLSPGGAGDEEAGSDADTSPASSPRAFRGARGLGHPQEEDIASSLPVSVYSSAEESADGGEGKAAAECAVCIVEFRDGDLARLLPRCGHRFHADCVGAWLQLHATCPLCRAGVVATAAASEAKNPKDDVDGAAAEEDDCPV